MSEFIHSYTDISRKAETWGRIAAWPSITKDSVGEYLKIDSALPVRIGALLRIAKATERTAEAVERIAAVLTCPNCTAIPRKLDRIARNAAPKKRKTGKRKS